jgi:hypothetical protein
MIAVFSFIEEPAIRPDLGGFEDLTTGAENDAHGLVV